MPSRNTGVLVEILDALGHLMRQPEAAFARLEEHYKSKLLLVAGDIELVQQQAHTLRLAISKEEAAQVLDHISEEKLVGLDIETTEEVINGLFAGRFQEP